MSSVIHYQKSLSSVLCMLSLQVCPQLSACAEAETACQNWGGGGGGGLGVHEVVGLLHSF